MYENEIYSGDRTGNHTTGTYQSYQTGPGAPDPGTQVLIQTERNIPAALAKNFCSVPAWASVLDCLAAWDCLRYSRQPAWIWGIPARRRTPCRAGHTHCFPGQ